MYVRTLTCSPLLSTKLMRVWVSSLSQKDDINVARSMPKHTHNDVFFGYLFFHPMMRTDLSGVPAQQFTQKRAMQLLAHSRRMLQKQHAGASGAWMRANIRCSIMHARRTLSILIQQTGYCCTRVSVFAPATHTKCAKKGRAQPQPLCASQHAHLSQRTQAWANRITPHATFTATVAQ